MQLRISEKKKKKEMRWGEAGHFRRGRKEGRKEEGEGSMRAFRSPAEAVIDCSNFTPAVGVGCLWLSA